jgi:hypothetical protein
MIPAGAVCGRVLRCGRLAIFAGLSGCVLPCLAQVNSWINPASTNWEDSASWSLGILPAANQSVMITNGGYKAVGIFPTTPVNLPAAMTVSDLTISATAGSANTLLLNYFGTAIPLNVLSNCSIIGTNGRILSLYSELQVGGSLTVVTNGSFAQQGGVTIVTNGSVGVGDGSVAVTNAVLMLAGVDLASGGFDQTGGSLNAQSLRIGSGGFGLDGGMASIGSINVSGNSPFFPGTISLNNGVLMSTNVRIFNGEIYQSGGQCIVNGDVGVEGLFQDYGPSYTASYWLSNGLLHCEGLSLFDVGGFFHYGGTNSVAGSLAMGDFSRYELSGGMLCTSNTTLEQENFVDYGYDTEFIQSGGVHWVTNTLTCDGQYAKYELQAGTLSAPNIVLVSAVQLEVGPLAVISSNASFTMLGGTLKLTNTVQNLGALAIGLAPPYSYQAVAYISFAPGSSKVTFADSSGQVWDAAQIIYVDNWNGSLSGGGTDQLIFGNSANGLTPAHLQHLRFNVDGSVPYGYWFAKILPTGEVVPTPVPPLTRVLNGTNLVINWPTNDPANFVLQAATNLAGPFEDIQTPSPYTNNTAQFPQRFFRLRQ